MATAEEQLVAAAQIVNSQSDQGERKARAYWELGRLIHEQLGPRSGYGQDSIGSLAQRLHLHTRTLYRARRFEVTERYLFGEFDPEFTPLVLV